MGDRLRWQPFLCSAAVVILLALPLVPAPVSAQLPVVENLYTFEIVADSTRADVPLNGQTILPLVFRDSSRDSPAAIQPGAPANPVLFHQVTFQAIPHSPDDGWTVFPPTSLQTYGGTDWPIEVPFQVTAQAVKTLYPVDIVATIVTSDGGMHQTNITLLGFSLGAKSFSAQAPGSFLSKPNTILDAPIRIVNLGMAPRSFDMEILENPCKMGVATSNNNLVFGKSEALYPVSLETPSSKLWYFSDLCTVTIQVSPSGQPDIFQNVFISVQVSGGYIDPVWIFNTIGILLVVLVILVLIARRKARIEEEILGKPQKPWLIPVEALYLKALKRKDARAWYVVRHYLMEDEYRSSLLWYKSYKKQTKGSRKKEGLVLRQEKTYEGWKKAWAKAIAKPLREADRFEAKLQKKLDRKAQKAHRKQMGKYRSVKGQMEKAHAKQIERASAKYEKAAAKARKKGLPMPAKPVIAKPDYPEEPERIPLLLADHKWAKKAARFRARRVREQGDLEVKFEKADARRLRKVRRKVQKLARKLDDPEFVAEHPLLQ
ncbi:MAG: hypothetical protein WC876_08675 [Candidatus Thermoplasmatota archaeon]